MNTLALDKILSSDTFVRDVFGGVFPSDKLPHEVKNYPKAYVANVDKASSPGSHWVAIYFENHKNGEFFDSLGEKPGTYSSSFTSFLDRNCTSGCLIIGLCSYPFQMSVDNTVFIISYIAVDITT